MTIISRSPSATPDKANVCVCARALACVGECGGENAAEDNAQKEANILEHANVSFTVGRLRFTRCSIYTKLHGINRDFPQISPVWS